MLWDLGLLLKPFWNWSWAVVGTWLAVYCIQFLVCPCTHLLRQLTDTTVGRTAGGVADGEREYWKYVKRASSLYDSKILQATIIYCMFPCVFRKMVWFLTAQLPLYIVGIYSPVGQLLNTQAPFIHWSSMNRHLVHSCNQTCIDSSEASGTYTYKW